MTLKGFLSTKKQQKNTSRCGDNYQKTHYCKLYNVEKGRFKLQNSNYSNKMTANFPII